MLLSHEAQREMDALMNTFKLMCISCGYEKDGAFVETWAHGQKLDPDKFYHDLTSEYPAPRFGVTKDGTHCSLEYFAEKADEIIDSCSLYCVFEEYEEDGDFGCKVASERALGFFHTEKEAEEFAEKYSNPYTDSWELDHGELAYRRMPDLSKIPFQEMSRNEVLYRFGLLNEEEEAYEAEAADPFYAEENGTDEDHCGHDDDNECL